MKTRGCRNGDGRKVYRASLCQACYRARPKTQQHSPPGEGGKVEFRASAALVEHATRAAGLAGLTPAAWWRRAGEQQILREEAERRFGRAAGA